MGRFSFLKTIKMKLFVVCNLVFMSYALRYYFHQHGFYLSVLVNLMVFIVPGLAWMGTFRFSGKDIVVFIFYDILLSTAILGIGIVLFYIMGIKVNMFHFLVYLFVITNIGLISGNFSKNTFCFGMKKKTLFSVFLVFVIAYFTVYYAAVHYVAPSEDNDVELQGTAYGLLNTLKPYMLTDRGTVYYFAHPLLMHFYGAHTTLLTGLLEQVKYYYDAAKIGERAQKEPLSDGDEIVFSLPNGGKSSRIIVKAGTHGVEFDRAPPSWIEVSHKTFVPVEKVDMSIEMVKKQRLWNLVENEYRRFNEHPYLFSTRIPHVFLSAMSGIILFMLLLNITSSHGLAFLGSILYFSFPEVLLFSSSELYTALTNFSLILCAYFYRKEKKAEKRDGLSPMLFLSGLFAAFSNHKAVIFPIAIILNEILLKTGRETWRQRINFIAKNKIVLGFILGSVMFWVYGLFVDPNTFFLEHFRYHLWNRIFHISALGYSQYPAIIDLWSKFIENIGYLFALIAILSVSFLLYNMRGRSRDESIFAIWSIVGAVIFSIIDWRQTLHLSLIMPALLISTFAFISFQRPRIKIICFLGLSLCLIRNILVIFSIGLG